MLFRSRKQAQDLPHGRNCSEPSHHKQAAIAHVGQILSSCYAIAIILPLCGAHPAYGADRSIDIPPQHVAAERPNKALQVTPYIWAAGLDGDISPFRRGPTIGVDKSFSDVIDNLNLGGFVNIWGRYNRFVVSGDVMYVSTTDGHGAGPLPAFQLPNGALVPAGTTIDATVDTKQFTATAMGGYRVIDTPQFTLDALGGARFWHISNDVTLNIALGSGITEKHDESFGWVDPVVGLRAFLPLTEKLSLQGQADIGGFGAGSDQTWSALATVNYVFADRLSASAGYKILDVNYDHDGHVYDTRLHGPVLGMTYRF